MTGWSRRRRLATAVLALVAAGAATVTALAARGAYEEFPRERLSTPGRRAVAPAWTGHCRRRYPGAPGRVCARVRGSVLWQERSDADGDGDRHLVVVTHLRPRIVKVRRALRVDPALRAGTTVTAIGFVMRGASGHDEIDAELIVAAGRRYDIPPAELLHGDRIPVRRR